ncbi:MAG: hypothetical protein ABR980_02945 [Ignavibacteriaceae bacterium]|jgi:hypothetical protein
MDRLRNRILAELENIDEIFGELPPHIKLPYISTLELAGVAALIHNFYNGIENIIKQILILKNILIPDGKSWHKELIDITVNENIISEDCKINISQYLAFRHFFSHSYALDLYSEKMEPLVGNFQEVYSLFKKEISKFL